MEQRRRAIARQSLRDSEARISITAAEFKSKRAPRRLKGVAQLQARQKLLQLRRRMPGTPRNVVTLRTNESRVGNKEWNNVIYKCSCKCCSVSCIST